MPSASLGTWTSVRTGRITRLRAAHQALGGTGPGRLGITDELVHALVLRLATEFQGFARDIHDEAGRFVAACLAPGNPQGQEYLRIPYINKRQLDRGNAQPSALQGDFWLFGLDLWSAIKAVYPVAGPGWREELGVLNKARNGIVHDEPSRVAELQAAGWPMTLNSVDRWRTMLDDLADGMDQVVGGHLKVRFGASPW